LLAAGETRLARCSRSVDRRKNVTLSLPTHLDAQLVCFNQSITILTFWSGGNTG
jgi:hypothetical protein